MFKYVKTFTDFPSIKNTRNVLKIKNHENKVVISIRKIYGNEKYTIEYTYNSNNEGCIEIYFYDIPRTLVDMTPNVVRVKIDIGIDDYYTSFELIMRVTKYCRGSDIYLYTSIDTITGFDHIFDSVEYNLLEFKSIRFEMEEYNIYKD